MTEARHRLLRFAGGAAAVLVVWFVGMAAAALVVTPTVVVAFGDPRAGCAGADGDLLASGRGFPPPPPPPSFLRCGRPTKNTVNRSTAMARGWWPVLTAVVAGDDAMDPAHRNRRGRGRDRPHRRARCWTGALRLAAHLRETESAATAAPSPMASSSTAAMVALFVMDPGPPGAIPVVLFHGTAAWSNCGAHDGGAEGRWLPADRADLPPFGYSERQGAHDPRRAGSLDRRHDDGAGGGARRHRAVIPLVQARRSNMCCAIRTARSGSCWWMRRWG